MTQLHIPKSGHFRVTKCTVVYEIDKCQTVLNDNEGGCR